ncbi:hypothetical protein KY366_01730 [Candidatus Woesearchaeota archaeon]|nr:hypothetical protein [Candidatus Woesearchaeota archaeon]
MQSKEEAEIIPKDKFYKKRLRNLLRATDEERLYKNGELTAIVFINKLFFLKFATWIANGRYKRKGYTSKCLSKIKKRHPLLFAKVQKGNMPSYIFAKKNDFKRLIKIPKFFGLHPGTLFYWKRNSKK